MCLFRDIYWHSCAYGSEVMDEFQLWVLLALGTNLLKAFILKRWKFTNIKISYVHKILYIIMLLWLKVRLIFQQ